MAEVAAEPRRYSVRFEVSSATVGTVLGLLINEVEGSKVEPTGDPARFRMSFVAFMSQLSTILGLIAEHAEHLVIAPFQAQASAALLPFAAKPRPVEVPAGVTVTQLPSRKSGRKSGGDPQSRTARAILGVLEKKPIAHPPDFTEAFETAGLSTQSIGGVLSNLIKYGLIVRCGYAAYRLPTEQEKIELRERRG